MALLAVAGLLASLRGNPYLLLLAFGVSFVPVGLYMLGLPGLFRGIGWLNLAWLAAAVLMIAGRSLRPA
jgi:hypothetical protein